MVYYNCMSKNVIKLIYSRVLCTNVTNRVVSWFDRFTTYYNCMSKNVTKRISHRVLFTSITIRALRLIWPFYGLLQLYEQKCHKFHISSSSLQQVSQIVFLADLTVFRFITTVWVKMSPNSYLREFCTQVSEIVLLADLTVLRLTTTVWVKRSPTHISASSVHKCRKTCC